jgi:tetratricopeptide (TPR) repeat protein
MILFLEGLRERKMDLFVHPKLPRTRFLSLPVLQCILIGILVGILYLNSLGNQFTNWDDGMIYENSTVRNLDWKGIQKIFTLEEGNTYQPLRMLSYAIDYRFWKLNPVGYRITNIFFYILTCIMVFVTIRLLSSHLRNEAPPDSHGRVALFGALLFVAHPVHVEAVTWLAARKEVLQGFFFFLAFYLYLRGREEYNRKKMVYLALSLSSILFAALSKPSAVVFPGVILIYEIARKKEGLITFLKKYWVFTAFSIIVSVVFSFILMKVMLEAGGIKPYHGDTFLKNVLVSVYAFLRSVKLLLFTINYSAAYSFPVTLPIFHLKNIAFIIVTASLIGVSFWSLKRTRVIFFSFFFFFVTMLPYLNIVPISTLLADRYVFIASFSYVFLLGIAFDRLFVYRQRMFSGGFFKFLSIVLLLFLTAGYSFMTIRQNKIWENSYTLWSDAVEKHPGSNTANALMGIVYMDLGMDEKAAEYLERAVAILPYDYESRNNLGIVYGRLGDREKALKELTTAISLRPDRETIWINLALFYQRQKEYKKAEQILKDLASKYPRDARLYFWLGMLYKEMGRYDLAITELTRSTELAPHIINPYEEIGNIYLSRLKNPGKAKFYYLKGIESAPRAKLKVDEMRWMIQDLECHQ